MSLTPSEKAKEHFATYARVRGTDINGNIIDLPRSGYIKKQFKNSRLALIGTAVNVKENQLAEITIAGEKALQEITTAIAEEAANRVRSNIRSTGWPGFEADRDIIDTGALLESVYVAYPGSQSVQSSVRGMSRRTQVQRGASPQSYFNFSKKQTSHYYQAIQAAKRKRPKTLSESYGVDAYTQRLKHDDYQEPDDLTSHLMDNPFNSFANTHRGNFYVALGVAVGYAIFIEEGRGGKHPMAPRHFFSPEVLWMQQEFARRAGNLEQYMKRNGVK